MRKYDKDDISDVVIDEHGDPLLFEFKKEVQKYAADHYELS